MKSERDNSGEIYWKAIEPIWKKISIYDGGDVFLKQFGAVRPELGHLFAAHWCKSEIDNGGFHQFFYNPTGVLAPEAAEGFQAIGLSDTAELIREAIKSFGSPYPREQEVRMAFLDAITGNSRAKWDPFYKLDNRFYDSLNQPGKTSIGEAGMRFYIAADDYALRISD